MTLLLMEAQAGMQDSILKRQSSDGNNPYKQQTTGPW